jgi:N-acetylneuraminic acid mutarotase
MAWTYPVSTGSPPGARAAHSCDAIGSKLYVFGGWNGKRALNDLYVLDTATMTWTALEASGRLLPCRNNHTTAVVDNRIYVHGGHDGSQWLADLFILDTRSTTWIKPEISGTPPSARACHTMSRVDRTLIIFGGYDGSRCFNDIELLDMDSLSWLQPNVSGQVPLARNAHSMTVIGTSLYLFGGHSGNKHLKDLHVLSTSTMTWSEVELLGSPPKGLRGHTSSLVGDKVYIFGGYDGKVRSNDLYVLSTETMKWTRSPDTEQGPAGRQRHSACAVNSRLLCIFGGFDGNKWLNDIYILDAGKLAASEMSREAASALLHNLRRLVNSSLFSDVTFVVEGRRIAAHKVMLAAQSEHFRAMLTNGMRETSAQEIEIPDWSYNCYVSMIEFLYTGTISDFSSSLASELLGLADAYALDDLRKLCEVTLTHSLTTEDVCDVLVLAHRCSAFELKRHCLAFVVKHFNEVNLTPGFERLEQAPSLLIEITRVVLAKLNSGRTSKPEIEAE